MDGLTRIVTLCAVLVGGCGGDGSGTTEIGETGATDPSTSGATGSTGDPPTTAGPQETGTTGLPDDTSGTPTTGPDPGTTAETTVETTDPTGETTGGGQPGEYEGFGAVTRGHEDCPDMWITYPVTSLADDGAPGTLRDALTAGCRLITFELGGEITLTETLNIRWSHITIDGASAPAPGITIIQPAGIATTIEAGNSTGPVSDVVIHHLRMVGASVEAEGADIWGLDGEANPVSRIVLDHITASGGQDGIFDLWSDVDDVTLSWNLMYDTVKMLHLSTNDLALARDRVSIHHNVFARNNERQIRIRHSSQQIDYVNNVIWGWGWFEGGAAGLHVAYDAGEVNPGLNVVGNVFHHVDGLAGDPDDAIRWEQGPDVGALYFADNLVPGEELDAQSNSEPHEVPPAAQVTTHAAATLAQTVVPHVGTHHPTPDEQALLDEIAAGL